MPPLHSRYRLVFPSRAPITLSTAHAKAGGDDVNGKHFEGGQFEPGPGNPSSQKTESRRFDAASYEAKLDQPIAHVYPDSVPAPAHPAVHQAKNPEDALTDKWLSLPLNAKLKSEAKEKISRSLRACLRNLPPKMLDKAIANFTKPPAFYNDLDGVTAEDNRQAIASGDKPLGPGKRIAGFFELHPDSGKGQLHFDHSWDGTDETATAIQAHEFGHAIDGLDEFSGTPEWHEIFRTKIDLPSSPLSNQARIMPCEAWAEWVRLIVTDVAKARKAFPEAWSYMQAKGLLDDVSNVKMLSTAHAPVDDGRAEPESLVIAHFSTVDWPSQEGRLMQRCRYKLVFEPRSVRTLSLRPFEESKHPRGQPENKGEFAPKGTPDSGPAPSDAYEHAFYASKEANHKSMAAIEKPSRASHADAAAAHLKAHELHLDSSRVAREAGNSEDAEHHATKADHHWDEFEHHEKAASTDEQKAQLERRKDLFDDADAPENKPEPAPPIAPQPPSRPAMQPATTIPEANEAAKAVVNRGRADYTGVSVDMANRVNAHLKSRIDSKTTPYGQKPFDDILVDIGKRKALMGTRDDAGRRTLYLLSDIPAFEKQWDDSKRAEQETGSPFVASSHLPRTQMVEAVIDHEIGHIVYDKMVGAQQAEWGRAAKSVPKEEWAKVSQMSVRFPEEAFQEAYMLGLNGREDLIPQPVRSFVMGKVNAGKKSA